MQPTDADPNVVKENRLSDQTVDDVDAIEESVHSGMEIDMDDDGAPPGVNVVDAGDVVLLECDIPELPTLPEDVAVDEIDEALPESIPDAPGAKYLTRLQQYMVEFGTTPHFQAGERTL